MDWEPNEDAAKEMSNDDVEYYLLDEEYLARVKYDQRTEEYSDGEILEADGGWRPCVPGLIVGEGEPISWREAKRRARTLGVRLRG